MKVSLSMLLAYLVANCLPLQAEVVRSNGKGGGAWSNPATWQGGNIPSGGPVSILSKDVVDVDSAAGELIACEEIVVDPQGVLRVVGADKLNVTITLKNGLKIFGGLLVDFANAPEGRCEFQWSWEEGNAPELHVAERSKIQLKGATGLAEPNVAFRALAPTNAPPGSPAPKPIPLTLGSRIWVEADAVLFEGFHADVRGVDGSGTKFNELAMFRNCHFLHGHVTFTSCTKIEFEGNTIRDTPHPAHGIYFSSTTHSRFVSNTIERANQSGIGSYGANACELIGNVARAGTDGIELTACSDIFLNENRMEENRSTGMTLNICNRISGRRNVYSSNVSVNDRAIHTSPVVPWRFFDCDFRNASTNANTASVSVENVGALELVNVPFQTFLTAGTRGPFMLSAYVDIRVTNEANQPLGQVPIRVLSGADVVATSRTEAVGPRTGHTPLPSTFRPLVVPWFRFAPSLNDTNPARSREYTLEVDGTRLGYAKQTLPLIVDESFLRTDPDKPTKTVSVKLPKAP